MNNAVCSEADAQKDERPHPSTFSKWPAKLRYLRTSGSSASPATSDTTRAHRPDPRPYPYRLFLSALSCHLALVALRSSGLRGPGSMSRLASIFLVV
jgi:hypothetical protein